MTTLVNPCPTVTPVVSGDLQRHLSSAARRTGLRYLDIALEHPADEAVLLTMGTLSLGAVNLAKHLNEAAGLAPSVGCQMLYRVEEDLRRLCEVPGDHSQELAAMRGELLTLQEARP